MQLDIKQYFYSRKLLKKILMPIYIYLVKKPKKFIRRYFFKKNATETLIRLDHIFKKNNITYWLDWGTLLGAVRCKDFIKHDDDIDVGIFATDYSKDLESQLNSAGFRKKLVFYKDKETNITLIAYRFKKVDVDIVFYTKHKNNKILSYWFYSETDKTDKQTIKEHGGLVVYKFGFTFFGVKDIKFRNIMVSIPINYDEYLRMIYGNNYLEENKNWDWVKMCPDYTIEKNSKGNFVTY